MMIKIFEKNSNGKIEFSKEELEQLLKEAWDDGYRTAYGSNIITKPYTTPFYYNIRKLDENTQVTCIETQKGVKTE